MKPFVKWAGGKRQILDRIKPYIEEIKRIIGPDGAYRYVEPFLGGGAVFFQEHPSSALINDLNGDLVNAYKVIQSDKYLELIELLKNHQEKYRANPDEYYYEIRSWDRSEDWDSKSDVEKAARMIFLNRTCYNGLYRVNSKNQFNTPIGRYKNPTICNEPLLKEIHAYLSDPSNHIEITNLDYGAILNRAQDNDIIYLDPPYDYEDDDGFTKYQFEGFSFNDFVDLKKKCDQAIEKNAYIIISNNATQKVLELFENDSNYRIYYSRDEFETLRSINCRGELRKTGREVIVVGWNNMVPPQADLLDKVVDLILAGPDVVHDSAKAMEVTGLTTNRQVEYYFSALRFLGFTKPSKDLTEKGEGLFNCCDESKIKKEILNVLLAKELYKSAFQKLTLESYDFDLRDFVLKKMNEDKSTAKLSDSTKNRRASSVVKWVEWMAK